MLKSILLISLIAISNISYGQDCYERLQQCETKVHNECVEKCLDAIDAADKHIEDLNQIIRSKDKMQKALEIQIRNLDEALEAEVASNRAWYRNPAITVLGGIVIGFIAASSK